MRVSKSIPIKLGTLVTCSCCHDRDLTGKVIRIINYTDEYEIKRFFDGRTTTLSIEFAIGVIQVRNEPDLSERTYAI